MLLDHFFFELKEEMVQLLLKVRELETALAEAGQKKKKKKKRGPPPRR